MVMTKFKCNSIIDLGENGKSVMLNAVYGDGKENKENKEWSKYTPSGSIQMQISNDTTAASQFEIGKEFLVTFEEA